MGKEIERKFLVKDISYKDVATSCEEIKQGYLSSNPEAVVRVRTKGSRGFLTVKSLTIGFERDEWEYEIPYQDAVSMLKLCKPECVLEKHRYNCGRWEVDEFHGRYEGLVLAEIELGSADELFEIPSYIGREVTGIKEYYNSVMANS